MNEMTVLSRSITPLFVLVYLQLPNINTDATQMSGLSGLIQLQVAYKVCSWLSHCPGIHLATS